MSVKRRVNWISQQRVDVPDMRALESAASNDFDELIKSFVTGTSQGYILRGFELSMAGAIGGAASGLQMIVDPGAVFHVSSSQSGTFLLVPPGTPAQQLNSATNTIVDGAFTPSSINYVGIEYERFIDDTTSAQVYIWNPTTNNETTKSAPRAQILRYRIKISTSIWATNVLPICTVTTDSGNNVQSITDARWGLFRLGTGGASPNPFFQYPWTAHPEGRTENPSTSSSNSVNPFHGGDKMLMTLKDWMNAIMSSLQEIKGTIYWYSPSSAGSIESLRTDLGNTVTTGAGVISHSPDVAGQINWDEDIFLKVIGSQIEYRLIANPSSTDITLSDNEVAYINLVRDVEISPNLVFTNSSAVVTSVGAIAWTGNLQAGDWVKLGATTVAGYYQIQSVDSLSQVTLTIPYQGASTGAGGAKAKYAFGSYQTSPSPSTNRHIQIAEREDVPQGQDIFWFLLRSDNAGVVPRVYVRFIGSELEMGETEEIDDGVPRQLLQYIGSPMESASRPNYTSALNPGSLPEITDITCGAAAAMSSNQYFFIRSAADSRKYHVWVNKDGTGVDPAPLADHIGVEWVISTGQTAQQTALALAAALDGLTPDDFTAVVRVAPNDMVVRVTNNSAGVTSNATNFNVGGLSVTIVQEGTGLGNFIINDGDNLTLAIKKLDQAFGQIIAALNTPSYDELIDVVIGTAVELTGVNDIFGSMITTWTSATRYNQPVVPSVSGTAASFTVYIRKGTNPVFDLIADICADSAGDPGTVLATSTNTFDVSTLNNITYTAVTFNFTGLPVVSGTTYHIVLRPVSFIASDPLEFQASQTYAPGPAEVSINSGTSWSPLSFPLRFSLMSSAGVGPNEIAGPVSSGTNITIPVNTRISGSPQQFYTVGIAALQVYLNGQFLMLGVDWNEVGAAGVASSEIEILQDLAIGDQLHFRISVGGAGSGGGGGVGPQGPPGPAGPPGADAIGGPVAISTKSGNYTLLTSDNVILGDATGGALLFTLPTAASAAGQVFFIKKIDSSGNAITVQANGVELIDGSNTQIISSQYVSITLVSNGTQWYLL